MPRNEIPEDLCEFGKYFLEPFELIAAQMTNIVIVIDQG
jgi:hypothetical protein